MHAGVPPPGAPGAAARTAARRRRQRRRAGAGGDRGVAGADVRAPATDADWQAHDLGSRCRRHAGSSVRRHGSPFGVFEVPLVGAPQRAQRRRGDRGRDRSRRSAPSGSPRGCALFAGVKRRLEVVGVADGVTVYDDFAHHPTAVAETLAGAARRRIPTARIWAVFEPRSASSCRRVFQDDFAARVRRRGRSADRADLPLDAAGSGAAVDSAAGVAICAAPGQSARAPSRSTTSSRASSREHRPGDLVVLMSNGGFGGIHQKLLQALVVSRDVASSRPAGDSALVVEFEERIDPARQRAGDRARAKSIQPANAWRASATSCRPTDRSPIYFDPLRTDYDALARAPGSARVRRRCRAAGRRAADSGSRSATAATWA